MVGAAIMAAGGAGVARWGLQLASGLIALLVYGAVLRLPRLPDGVLVASASASVVLIASTLLASGIDGVSRWIELPGLRLHPSALLTPALIVIAARWVRERPAAALVLLGSVQIVHVLQPDAGQATALGAAAAVLVLGSAPRPAQLAVLAAVVASMVAAWLRPDPLPPAPFVEDIVGRAFALGLPWGVGALASIVALPIAPYAASARRKPLTRHGDVRDPSTAIVLAAYFAASFVVVLAGEFPVPLLGYGPSPIVGAFLGLAVLRRSTLDRDQQQADGAAVSPAQASSE